VPRVQPRRLFGVLPDDPHFNIKELPMRWFRSQIRSKSRGARPQSGRGGGLKVRPSLEALESRVLPAVHLEFIFADATAQAFFDDSTPAGQMHLTALNDAKTALEMRLEHQPPLTADTIDPSMVKLGFDPITGNQTPVDPNSGTGGTQVSSFSSQPGGSDLTKIPPETIPIIVGVHGDTHSSIGGFATNGDKRGTNFAQGVPLVGAVSFSNDPDTNYDPTKTPPFGDFIAIAEHELTHALGFNDTFADWANLTSGKGPSGHALFFTGANAIKEYTQMGGVIDAMHPGVPLDLRQPGHWAPWPGEYEAGNAGVPDPNQGIAGFFQDQNGGPLRACLQEINPARLTELDFAALKDIGWNISDDVQPPPMPDGSAGPQMVVDGFQMPALTNKQNPPSTPGFQERDPTVATLTLADGTVHRYQGFTDGDQNVTISVDDGPGIPTGEQARGQPSLTVLTVPGQAPQLFMAWTGTDSANLVDRFGSVNVTGIGVNLTSGAINKDQNGNAVEVGKQTLGYTSEHAPALTAFDGALFLAWAGLPPTFSSSGGLFLDVKDPRGPKSDWGPNATDTGERTNNPPTLTVFAAGGQPPNLILGWSGSDNQPNIATVQPHLATVNIPQTAPVTGKSLAISGDQFGSGYDDNVSVGQDAANGKVQVTLNGQVFEFDPASLDHITVYTGGGNNTVHILAAFPGIAMTVNGNGTDRLSFGPGLPTPTYTPDATGRPGWGTINLGGMSIGIAGLDFVDGVAPHVTALGDPIDENSVATVAGTFTDPGAFTTDSVAMDWGDGSSDPAVRLALGARSFALSHRYLEEGSFTATATVTNNDNLTGTGTAPVAVDDPHVQATGSFQVAGVEGAATAMQTVATFTDPAPPEPNAADDPGGAISNHYAATIDWGDGNPATAGVITFDAGTGIFTVQGSHTFAEEGSFSLSVVISHENSTPQTVTGTAMVSDPPVLAAGGLTFQTVRGGCLTDQTPVATFTDPGGAEPNTADPGPLANHYTATINWGDGTPTVAATVSFAGTPGSTTDPFTVAAGPHTYTTNGTYTITVTVNHERIISTATDTAVVVSVLNHAQGIGDSNSLLIGASLAGDVIRVVPEGAQTGRLSDKVKVLIDGVSQGIFSGFNSITIYGQSGNDDLGVAGTVRKNACIFGGGGNDRIAGGGGNNILVGGAGNDLILGGQGRDLLIGGGGSDQLVGGPGGDILVGAATAYDDPCYQANRAALTAIRAVWTSSLTYSSQVAGVLGWLGGSAVQDDGGADTLAGGAGLDLFFAGLTDAVTGLQKGERVVAI
jgi:hypothetical protein